MKKIILLIAFISISSFCFGQKTVAQLLSYDTLYILKKPYYSGYAFTMYKDIITSYPNFYGSYSNPSWITSLAWSKITGAPTTYAWSSITGTPTTLSGYGITNGVPSSRTLTINGVTYDLTADRSWTISSSLPADADGVLQNASGVKSWGNMRNLYIGAGGNNGSIPYWNGSNYSYTAVGTNKQILISVGGGAPSYVDGNTLNGSWNTVTLTNSWAVSSSNTVQWRYSISGRVELRGKLDSTSASSDAFCATSSVPSPNGAPGVTSINIPVVNATDGTIVILNIGSLGDMRILSHGSAKIYHLDGVSYLASY